MVAAALTACDSGDGSGGGGSGGTGGGGHAIDCGSVRVLTLESATNAVLQDSTDSRDNWEGSCAPEESVGNDVVVHFRAPEAGFYRFSTEGTDFDTLLYALRDCKNGFTQFACDDNGAGGGQSLLLIDLQADEDVFLVVDSVNVREARPFRLSVERVEAQRPVIENMEAFANAAVSSGGLRLSGTSADSPVVAFAMQLYAGNTALLSRPFEARFDEVDILRVTQEAGAFSVEGSFVLQGAPRITRIEFTVVDQNGLRSETISSDTRAPGEVGRGSPCDPAEALNKCGAADACVSRPAGSPFTCQIATPPTLEGATASSNLDTYFWGVVVTGFDPEADVAVARVLPRQANNNPLPVVETGATVVPFHQLGQDETTGAFRGVVVLPARFDSTCVPPAQADFDACMARPGASQQACYDQAIAVLEQCERDTLALVDRIEVEVIDATGKISTRVVAQVEAAPNSDIGGICDPRGAIGACAEGMVCWSSEAMEPELCQETGPLCPNDFGTIDLADHVSGNRWVYTGNNAGAPQRGASSCGGGGPADVLAFTAPEAGSYQFATSGLGGNVDTLVAVRRFCQLPAYELACNDDVAQNNVASSVRVDLDADQTVYVLVDSYNGAFPGAYTLTVTRQ